MSAGFSPIYNQKTGWPQNQPTGNPGDFEFSVAKGGWVPRPPVNTMITTPQQQADMADQREQRNYERQKQTDYDYQQRSSRDIQQAFNSALSGLSSGSGGSNGSWATSGGAPSPGGSAPSPGGHVAYGAGNESGVSSAKSALDAAQSAAFGAAKSKAGALARSSVNSMRGELAGRGVVGGGTEARGLMSRIAAATNPLSDINVAQLGEQSNLVQHEADMAQHGADTQYQGGIAQRGQDMQAHEQEANRMAVAQNQIVQQKASALVSLQQALAGLTPKY